MDKNSRSKAAEGGSSDEEEAFESADEGEEGAKNVKPPFATSADIGSANSTSKEPVGKNDTSIKSLATSGDDIKSGTAELGEQNPKMDENIVQENNEIETLAEDEPEPCVVSTVSSERSPSTEESVQATEESNKTVLVEDDTGNISRKFSENETKAAIKSEREHDEEEGDKLTEADKFGVNLEQDQSLENETELVAKENIVAKDGDGQNEASENLVKEQQKVTSESTCDDKCDR